jgi:hypothetical protein
MAVHYCVLDSSLSCPLCAHAQISHVCACVCDALLLRLLLPIPCPRQRGRGSRWLRSAPACLPYNRLSVAPARACEAPPRCGKKSTAVHACTTCSKTASHLLRISASVASWMGWATSTRRIDAKPSFAACSFAALSKRSDSSEAQATPLASSMNTSRVWQVVQLPQSANPSTTKSAPATSTLSRNAAGAGLVNVGLDIRSTVALG